MCDDFDFHAGATRQGGDLYGGSRGEIDGEIFGVNLIHPGEVGEVGQEDGAFDDVVEGELLVVEDGFDIFENAFGLGLDVAGNKIAGGGIEGDLAGAEEQVAHANGVAVRTDGRSGFGGFYDLLWHVFWVFLSCKNCGLAIPPNAVKCVELKF